MSLPGFGMAEEIFLQVQSPVSWRYAVLDDDGRMAFLYLTEPGVLKPVKDAVVYTRMPPIESVDWEHIQKTGETPLLRSDIASSRAIIQDSRAGEFTFKWSADGHSVAVLRNAEPLAFVAIAERLGYSKAVATPSSLANAWNQELYDSLFGK